MCQTEEQEKAPERGVNEMVEITNLLDTDLKVTVIKILTEQGERINDFSEKFNKRKSMKRSHSCLKSTKHRCDGR